MTQDRDQNDERAALAGEFALGLLTGDAQQEALALLNCDSAFAEEVARWRGRTAPWFAEFAPATPPADGWSRIEAATTDGPRASDVIDLRRRVGRWRAATAGMTALAASLAIVLMSQLEPSGVTQLPDQPQPSAPMVAMLGDEQKQMKVVASWDPVARQLVLAVPGNMSADPRHAHELWVIPADGKPRSLGTMPTGKQMHVRLAVALAQLLQQGATIAISVEPRGGSPTGKPTGPVVVSGALSRA